MATYNAGIVTAYGAAVQGGYTGTYEEYCRAQAGIATNAQMAEAAAERAEAAAASLVIDTTLKHAGQAADAYAVGSNLINYNSYDLLRGFATYTNRVGAGVTYTWNDAHTVCTAVGTTTGLSIDNLYSDNGMPAGIEAGKTYQVKCTTTDTNLMLEVIPYSGSTSLGSTFITEDTDYTVPDTSTKLIIRLRTRHTPGSPSTVNATISIQILNAPTNEELAERTEANKTKSDYAIKTIDAYNAFDLLQKSGTYADKTSGGVTYTWNTDKTVCTAVGTTTGLSIDNLYAGSGMPAGIEAGKTYRVMCTTTDINLMLEIISYAGSTLLGSVLITENTDYTVPDSATKLIIRLRTRYTTDSSSTVNASISVSILSAMSNAELTKAVKQALANRPLAYMQIFPKYTTIGDSLMGGYMNRNGVTINTATAKAAGNNWVNYLSLRIGRTFTNLAVGGSTTGDWRATHLSGANIETNCYLVGLGVNDHRQSVAIGSVSDIATNFADNASTFYGNYDYIIRQLRAWNPAAHIFCFTIPTVEGGTSANYNVAIRAICALYPDYVHCIDLASRDEYADSIITANYTGGHFNPVAYSYMSEVIEKAINAFVNDNNALFATAPYV